MSDTLTKDRPQKQEKPKLDEQQAKFIKELAKSAGAKLKEAEKRVKQQALIDSVANDLDIKTGDIKNGQTFQLMEKNSGVVGALYTMVGRQKSVASFDEGGDQNKEFEVGDAVMSRFDELPPDVLKAIGKAQQQIVALQEKLRN